MFIKVMHSTPDNLFKKGIFKQRWTTLKKQVSEILENYYKQRLEEIKLVIYYGSLDRDVDLLIVSNFKNRVVKKNRHFFIEKKPLIVDILEIPCAMLNQKLELLDIVYTEPILTGHFAFGDIKLLNYLREKLTLIKSSESTLTHLFKEGLKSIDNAVSCFNLYKKEEKKQKYGEWALINLSFACSYSMTCKYYRENSKVVTFKEILGNKNAILLRKVYKYSKEISHSEKNLSLNRIHKFISETQKEFVAYRPYLFP